MIRQTTTLRATLSTAARQRDIKRQLRLNQTRKLIARRTHGTISEFGSSILAALIGCWVISELTRLVLGIDPLYTLSGFGLLYSSQATYHKHRLARDPAYEVPRCACAGKRRDATEAVLSSRASAIAGIPNSLLACISYLAVIALRAVGHADAIEPIAAFAVATSAYLSYVMVTRIKGLCATCITLSAINVLILLTVTL